MAVPRSSRGGSSDDRRAGRLHLGAGHRHGAVEEVLRRDARAGDDRRPGLSRVPARREREHVPPRPDEDRPRVHGAAHSGRSRSASRTSRRPGASSRRRASSSPARRSTRASATWRSSTIRTGTRSCSTGATHRMNKQEALERYEALPVPDKTQEPWMFTDLAGFDPAAFSANGAAVPNAHERQGRPARHRRCRCRARLRGRDPDRARARGRPLRAARRARAARHARRRRRQVQRAQPRRVAARPARRRPEGSGARAAALREGREHGRGRLALLAPAGRPARRARGRR